MRKRTGASVAKRMTVVFEDEELYAALKIEAARKGQAAEDIVAQAVREWLEGQDEELRADVEEARQEWDRDGGREAGEFLAEVTASS